ncbi:hypothetical protein CNQ79_28325 [Bacillus cereus]|nr:hypothetical protein CNQ79_28325 [Bacillus cereus]
MGHIFTYSFLIYNVSVNVMMKERYLEFYGQKNRKKTIHQSSFFLLYILTKITNFRYLLWPSFDVLYVLLNNVPSS